MAAAVVFFHLRFSFFKRLNARLKVSFIVFNGFRQPVEDGKLMNGNEITSLALSGWNFGWEAGNKCSLDAGQAADENGFFRVSSSRHKLINEIFMILIKCSPRIGLEILT